MGQDARQHKARLVNFLCSSCNEICSTKNQLNCHHVEMHKQSMSCATCYKTFYCPQPLFVKPVVSPSLIFDSHKELVKHNTVKHKGESVHPCSVCDKCYKSLPMLNQHMSGQHRSNVLVFLDFDCKFCGKEFPTENRMTTHIIQH